MTISPRLRDQIRRDQTTAEYIHYDTQAHHTFLTDKDGYVDCKIITAHHIAKCDDDNAALRSDLRQPSVTNPRLNAFDSRVTSTDDLDRILRRYQNTDRFFFLRQRHSRSRLEVSRALLEHLCYACGIFTKFRDYVVCFGIRKSDVFPHPPALHFDLLSTVYESTARPRIPGFELAYILRFVEYNQRTEGIPWSLRQSGIYHKFDALSRRDTWLSVALTNRLEQSLTSYLSDLVSVAERDPYELHYVLLNASLAGWKSCINNLADEIQRQSDMVFLTEMPNHEFSITRLEERQMLKRIEDFISDLQLALSLALEDTKSLMSHCRKNDYQQHTLVPTLGEHDGHQYEQDRGTLSLGFANHQRDIVRYQTQLSALQQKVQSVSYLLSNILDLSNGEALKLLAVETKVDHARTALMTQKAVEDAATVKVLTIITLVYLPLTVVTNFFSTSFVNLTAASGDSSHITITSDVWVLFVVGIPLTVITIYIWWVFSRKEVNGSFPTHISSLSNHINQGLIQRRKPKEGPVSGGSLDI